LAGVLHFALASTTSLGVRAGDVELLQRKAPSGVLGAKAPESMKPNTSADFSMLLYMSTLFVGGIALIAATPSQGWGLMGYFGGGMLAFAGASMIVGRSRDGASFVDFACPLCDHPQTCPRAAFEHGRSIPCTSCQTYLEERDGAIVALDDETVCATPIFEAPMPAGTLRWPRGCALCGSIPVEQEEVHGTSVQSRCLITRSVRVPVCVHHRGQQAVSLTEAAHMPGVEGFALRFRSHAAARHFRSTNPTPPPRAAERADLQSYLAS
jgi:hypothetical protein